jgi:transcriptional regulator with XRE-family HTH domain
MQVGNVIRKYRKEINLTQEEMAKRLGVTASAVNKWENGYSLPDISLLSSIARLLDISIDTLLSYEKELSDAEASQLVAEANKKLKTEPVDEVLQWMKQCLAEYPNCDYLCLWMARIFFNQRQIIGFPDEEKYDTYILDCYQRVLKSNDARMKNAAAESLYYFYMSKNQYEQAEKYLIYFSQENPERKRKQAMICSKTGRLDEAYKAYEELLYAGYQNLNMAFHDIYILAMEENDLNKAHILVDKMQKLAHLFEFGEYHEVSPALELATLEKKESETLHIMERMLTNLESLCAFTKSSLYSHMDFKAIDDEYLTEVREGLMEGFRDEQTYAYLKDNQRWRELLGLSVQ